jgi:hypothetical protein
MTWTYKAGVTPRDRVEYIQDIPEAGSFACNQRSGKSQCEEYEVEGALWPASRGRWFQAVSTSVQGGSIGRVEPESQV